MKTNTERSLLAIAFLASIAALVAALVVKPSAAANEDDPSQLADLISRMEKLEARLAKGEKNQDPDASKSSAFSTDETQEGGIDLAEIAARQSRLEQQLQKYGIIERFEAHEQLVKESYQKALDVTLSAKQRFEALKLLGEEGKIDGPIVSSMMDLWEASLRDEKMGPYHRWALMENLRGSDDPRFRDNVLSMLQQEPGAKMTGQAISTLEPMLPDPSVEEWLTHIRGNSQDPKIREYAARVLENAGEPGE
jgi:hypothetical protein